MQLSNAINMSYFGHVTIFEFQKYADTYHQEFII